MSTYLYLECQEHDPVLRSGGEVGQHLYDLPRIRLEIRNRDAFVALNDSGVYPIWGNHFTSNAAEFLVAHPRCMIGIRDEYGREHPLCDVSDSVGAE